MLKKVLVMLLLTTTTTCRQEPEIIVYPYSDSYQINTSCLVEEWYNIEGIEVHKCYR